MPVRDTGSDRLRELSRNARRLDGTNKVPLADLLPPSFIRKHSQFQSFDDLVEASPWDVQNEEDFLSIPDAEFDKYIQQTTSFDSFQEMQEVAGTEWVSNQLGF